MNEFIRQRRQCSGPAGDLVLAISLGVCGGGGNLYFGSGLQSSQSQVIFLVGSSLYATVCKNILGVGVGGGGREREREKERHPCTVHFPFRPNQNPKEMILLKELHVASQIHTSNYL